MPIEASLLKDAPIEASQCPKCEVKPFEPFMRGLVHRRKKKWPWSSPRPYCAVICRTCKEIIAWEQPENHDFVGTDLMGKDHWVRKPADIIHPNFLKLKGEIQDVAIKHKVQDAAICSAANSMQSSSASAYDNVQAIEVRRFLEENDPTSKF